jgi:hypothetical protein
VYPTWCLTHLTSLPLCSYNRRYPDNRLDNEVFQITLQRKLRLPIPIPSTPCLYCHQPFDPYGDHLFRCKYSKKILSDNIRDTIYTLCSNLAPMAEFVQTKHDVSCETANLLPTHPGKRPADVGLCLRPKALPSKPDHPVNFLAIDITTTSPPVTQATAAATPEPARPIPKQTPISKAHLDSLWMKLTHSQLVNDSDYFQALLNNKILLLPFTVDPFGGLGSFAHNFCMAPSPLKQVHPLPHLHQTGVPPSDLIMPSPTTNNCNTSQ